MTGSCLVYLLSCFCFSTHSLFLYALGFQPALPSSSERYTRRCSFHSQRKKKMLHVVQKSAYLFRLTCWMLLQTPSPPLKHSAKSSHFPLNHQTGPMLSWTLSAIFFFYFLFYFIIFRLFIYLDNFEFLRGKTNSLSSVLTLFVKRRKKRRAIRLTYNAKLSRNISS